jgi:CheY-like chemotaxis protein
MYQILRRHYIEQLTQQQVAADLGLSVRQLQRSEKLAREVLTDFLWSTYNLDQSVPRMLQADATEGGEASPPSMTQELEWLQDSVPAQPVSCVTILCEIISVLKSLLEDSALSVKTDVEGNIPEVYVKMPLFRQAILNILNSAVQCCQPGGLISISVSEIDSEVRLHFVTNCPIQSELVLTPEFTESILMASRLMNLCHGHLVCVSASESEGFVQGDDYEIIVTLPVQESIDILVVDDNADVLQLFERYMAGTRFRFKGTQNAQEGLDLAINMQPAVVLLDVMMPGRDGWTLLSQIREHPTTQDIPIIVCSILSQEQFAMAMGAADFIRKPVNRQAFLEVLDRQLDLQQRESG